MPLRIRHDDLGTCSSGISTVVIEQGYIALPFLRQYLQSLPLHVRHAVFEDSKVPVELVGLREEQFALQRQFKRRFPVSSSLLSFLVPVDGFKFAAGSVFGH